MKNIPKKQFAGWMLMLLLCISISAFAQSPKKVTGRVMDATHRCECDGGGRPF